jgi:peptidoglycan/xylan/chitin deacetylase (PgdA/CDA1 family)
MRWLKLLMWLLLLGATLGAQPVHADCADCAERARQFWPEVSAQVASTPAALADYLARHEIAPSPRLSESVYFLTPDCGIEPYQLENVLDSAKLLDIHLTVFLMGNMIDRYPEQSRALLKRLVAEGHELGLHSYDHRSFVNMGNDGIYDEVVRNWALIDWALGYHYPIRFIRLPFGARNPAVMQAIGALGLQSVFWDIDSLGWYSWATAPIVQNQVVSKMKPGGVVVLHCSSVADRAALPLYVSALRQQGYQPQLLSTYYAPPSAAELAGYPRIHPMPIATVSQPDTSTSIVAVPVTSTTTISSSAELPPAALGPIAAAYRLDPLPARDLLFERRLQRLLELNQ